YLPMVDALARLPSPHTRRAAHTPVPRLQGCGADPTKSDLSGGTVQQPVEPTQEVAVVPLMNAAEKAAAEKAAAEKAAAEKAAAEKAAAEKAAAEKEAAEKEAAEKTTAEQDEAVKHNAKQREHNDETDRRTAAHEA